MKTYFYETHQLDTSFVVGSLIKQLGITISHHLD